MRHDSDERYQPGQAAISGSDPGMPQPPRAGESYPTAEMPGVPRPAVDEPGRTGRRVDERIDDRDAPADGRPDAPVVAPVVVRAGGGFLRGVFWSVATVALVVALFLGVQMAGWLPGLHNPFASKTTDRSQPVLLQSIQDLSRFVAAEGNFQVVIDLQNDKKYVPDFLVNDRTLFVAAGSVEAYVDFATIGQGAITESLDHKTVEIKLPAPALNKPNLDHDKSYVFAQQRGLLNRVSDLFSNDPNRQQELYKLGEQKIADAAKDSGLAERAQENTRKMLDSMLRSLGYSSITVTFAAP